MKNNKIKKFTVSAIAGAAFLCSSALLSQQNAEAATNTSPVSGILTVHDKGKGPVRLLDQDGNYQKQKLNNKTDWIVWEKGIINDQVMYRIGNNKQWIPAKFSSIRHEKAKDRKTIEGIATVTYKGKGKVRLFDSNGDYQNQYLEKGSRWKVFEVAKINGEKMYRLGSNKQWIPARFVKFEEHEERTFIPQINYSLNSNLSSHVSANVLTDAEMPVISNQNGGQTTPSTPATPVTPNQNGGQTTPSKPATPVTPSQNGGQTTPSKPATPVTPNQNGGQTTPSKPATPVTPSQNGGQTTPSKPATPVTPSQNGGQTTPSTPATPVTPNQSGGQTTPSKPATPVTPSQNGGQTTPSKPATPVTPSQNGGQTTPSKPATPVTPSQNGGQTTPSKPATPVTPSQNGGQTTPSKPATPVTPNQNGGQTTPSKPTTPVTPSQNNKGTWSNAEVQEAQSAFIDYVNNWRRKEGLNPFENTVSWLQEGAESRANDNQKLFEETGNISHTRPNGSDWTTAFNVKSGSLGGENIGYEGNSNGMTPVEAAQQIANGFINEGPDGGHYAVLHAAYGTHPAIGVAFRNVYRDGQQVYLLNMETGTNSRVAGVATVLSGDAEHEQEWAAKWKGMTAPSLKEYVYTKNGKVHVRKSDFPNDMGYEPGEVEKYPQLHLMPEDQLQSYEDAYVKYLQEKYNAIVE